MKKLKIMMIVGIVGSMLLMQGCGDSSANNAAKKTSNKATVDVSGVVMSSNVENIMLDLPMGANAKINKVLVKQGQKIKKGDKLMELDLSDYNNLIATKEDDLESARLSLKDMPDGNAKKAQQKKIDSAEKELAASKAKVKRSFFADNNIVSDMDNAIVGDLGYKNGDTFVATPKGLTIMDVSKLYVRAKVDEEFIKDVKEGRDVTIVPAADSTKQYKGKVTMVASEAINENGEVYIPVEISIDNNDGLLMPNYNVDLSISKK